jgi:hypothetical protein
MTEALKVTGLLAASAVIALLSRMLVPQPWTYVVAIPGAATVAFLLFFRPRPTDVQDDADDLRDWLSP